MRSLPRSRRRRLLFAAFMFFALLVVATQSGWVYKGSKLAQSNQPGLYPIARYIDGDTIQVDMNGNLETVRFIGVDTPETHKPNTPVQCYGETAAANTRNLISQFGRVRLQADPLDTNRDRYGRLLRYVYLPDGTLLDEKIIQTGYGFAYLGFPFTKSAQFAADQQSAINAHVGLWSACRPFINQYGGYSSNPAS